MAGVYETWLVVERNENALTGVVRTLGLSNKVDITTRPLIGLTRADDHAVMTLRDERVLSDFFAALPSGQKSVRALSLAPYDDIRFFDGKMFLLNVDYYRVSCMKPRRDEPYWRRLITIQNVTTQLQKDWNTGQTKIQYGAPKESFLWLNPEAVELTEEQVLYLFGPNIPATLRTAFFLPPIRKNDHPDVVNSYFQSDLCDLRETIGEILQSAARSSSGLTAADEPDVTILYRLVNEPLLRDLFLDGGGIDLVNNEGEPTSIALKVNRTDQAGQSARANVVLAPETVQGPAWAPELAGAIRGDIASLILGGLPISICGVGEALDWRIPMLKSYELAPAPGGSYDKFSQAKRDWRLSESSNVTFTEKILLPSRRNQYVSEGQSVMVGDNDLIERLFINMVWRCPWNADPEYRPWRLAMLEIMEFELLGKALTPVERVAYWNEQESAAAKMTFSCIRNAKGNFVLRHSGEPDPDLVIKWRLLLPLGAVVNARTIYLDNPKRSKLDQGFVLA